jgi:hypothetical protein
MTNRPATTAVSTLIAEDFPWLAAHTPRPPHLVPYGPMTGGAFVTLEFFPNDDDKPAYCARVADHVARLYEQAFAPDDDAFVYAVKQGAHGWMLPEDEELVVEPDQPIDLTRFSTAFFEDEVDTADDVRLTERIIGADAMAVAEWTAGVNLFPRTDEDDPDIPFVEMFAPITAREIDYHTLFLGIAHKDFPTEGRPYLGWTYVQLINATTSTILDMPDDRYAGLHAPDPDGLREAYRSNAPVLNEYRREHMEATFGFWPKDSSAQELG